MIATISAMIIAPILVLLFVKLIQGNNLTWDEKCLLQIRNDLKKYGAPQNLLINSCMIGLFSLVKKQVTKGNEKNPLTFKQKSAMMAGCDQVASWACRIYREEKVPDAAYLLGVAHILLMNDVVKFSPDYIEYIRDRLAIYGALD